MQIFFLRARHVRCPRECFQEELVKMNSHHYCTKSISANIEYVSYIGFNNNRRNSWLCVGLTQHWCSLDQVPRSVIIISIIICFSWRLPTWVWGDDSSHHHTVARLSYHCHPDFTRKTCKLGSCLRDSCLHYCPNNSKQQQDSDCVKLTLQFNSQHCTTICWSPTISRT